MASVALSLARPLEAMGQNAPLLLVVALVGAALLIFLKGRARPRLPLPPGPRKRFLIKNLLDVPKHSEWEVFLNWGKQYGSDIIHLSAAGKDIVVLNSFKAMNDLFDKRSSIYSSRPHFFLISTLIGWDWLISAMVYGEPWRQRRRLFNSYFHPGNEALYEPSQVEFIRKMLPRILAAPENFLSITRHTVGGLTLSLAYGINIEAENDPYIAMAEKAGETFTAAAEPGAFLVEVLPGLQYVPAWVLGMSWKRGVRAWRETQENFRELPFNATLKDMASGIARPSFTSVCLEKINPAEDVAHQHEVVKDTAGTVFAAGADTTVGTVHVFFAAMLCFPEAQKKAQEELDRVLNGRLPDFRDEKDLPYVAALVKEVLRWKPVTPLAVPHYLTKDDEYKGYHIPKGALMIGNAWAMLHDEDDYPDPMAFRPERFLKEGKLDPSVRDPSQMAFGFGRRICPGAHIGTSILWLVAASVLSTFTISGVLDKEGMPIEPVVEWKSGLMYRPCPFKCTIKPRSKAAEEIIRSEGDAY